MRSLFCFVILCLTLNLTLYAQETFQVLLVADTSDFKIGKNCSADIYRFRKSLSSIARHLNMQLHLTRLEGENCRWDRMRKWFQTIPQSDIVLFYYSGHGDADRFQNKLPELCLQEGEARGIWIKELMSRVRCRLSIILLDCCNPYEKAHYTYRWPYGRLIHDKLNLPGLKNLFLHSHGTILACAASQGESAICQKQGSYFSMGFILALKNLCKNPNVSWTDVCKWTSRYATARSKNAQHPFFSIQ